LFPVCFETIVCSVVDGPTVDALTLMNARSGRIVASAIEVALTRAARNQGLLERSELDPASALVLAPCFMIHTASMRFAIDVIFVDRSGRVVRIVRDLRPWRVAGSFAGYATIELAAGALESRDVVVGDHLYLETVADAGSVVTRQRAFSSTLDGLRKTASRPVRRAS
jgi:uncharacterized membrane protein (UPF0127 family)